MNIEGIISFWLIFGVTALITGLILITWFAFTKFFKIICKKYGCVYGIIIGIICCIIFVNLVILFLT
jgi:hypothetical protein